MRDDASDDSDLETQMAAKKSSLNNLFGGRKEDSDEEEDEAYMQKLSKQDKKKGKKKFGRDKDKISTKDARVLTGGQTVADHAELGRLQAKMNERSKVIKKNKNTAEGTSNELTKAKVMAKLKKSRVAISTYRINK